MSAPKTVVSEAVPKARRWPFGYVDIALPLAGRRTMAVQAWVLALALALIPLAAYWPATFHDYGLRDDYSNLREAHEEPGTILKFCASHGRPVYGWMLQATYGQTGSVQDLQWMRLSAALLLGAIALVMFRGLRAVGWSRSASLWFAVLVELLPSAQVIAGWAVGWPYAAAALLSIAGFFTVEGSLTADPLAGWRRIAGQYLVALGLTAVSALIYQPSTLFYVVPMAGALIARRDRGLKETARWLALHLGSVTAALGLAYCTISALYASGMFVKSGRIAFEQHWGEKFAWFVHEMLPNALSMLILNDNNYRDHGWYLGCAAAISAVLLSGLFLEWRRHGHARGLIWAVGLLGLPVFAAGVSLVASERYATYRTIFAMSAVLLCFLVASVRSLTQGLAPSGRRLLAAAVVGVAFIMAQHHVYALIAVPQGNEWNVILEGARQVNLNAPARPRVFAIASSPKDISTATIYHDEFGSLSSNSEWVPKEMFKRAMQICVPASPIWKSATILRKAIGCRPDNIST